MSYPPETLITLDLKIRRAVLILLYLGIAAAVVAMATYLKPWIRSVLDILSPFMVALIVAYIFNPIVVALQVRFRMRRTTSVLVAYAVILLLTATFFAVVLPLIYIQLRTAVTYFVENLPVLVNKAQSWLAVNVPAADTAHLREVVERYLGMGETGTGASTQAVTDVTRHAATAGRVITKFIGAALGAVVGTIAFISFVVVITFYFLLDYRNIERVVRVLLPDENEPRFFRLWQKIDTALGGFLRGQLLVSTIVGTLYIIALMLLGMKKYAFLIGFMAGLGNMIPYLGPVVGGVPAGLWVLLGDNSFVTPQQKLIGIVIVVLIGVIIQTLDGFVFQPRIVGRNAELHPLLVLFALLIGAQFGLGGLILAVPVAIAARVLIKEFWWDPLEAREVAEKAQARRAVKDPPPPAPAPQDSGD